MILYRITNCNYAGDLAGTGARLYGGRWNSEGKAMLYLASSRALALLEVLVHLPPLMVPDNYCLTEITVPADSILNLDVSTLPQNWQELSMLVRELGDRFLKEQKYLLMRVPSSIIPAEFNYLLNPLHPAITAVKIRDKQAFNFDERLFY